MATKTAPAPAKSGSKSKDKGGSGGKDKTAPKKPSAPAAADTKGLLDLRQVTSSYNHRQALSSAFEKEGYGVFVSPPGSDKTPLWELATSDDPAQRQQYVELMDALDKVEDEERKKGTGTGGIIDLAFNILSNGQLQAIGVRDNGKKASGKSTYQLVWGHRRSLAMLYLWCKGLVKTPEPRIKYDLIKGNHQQLQAASISENLHRKPLTLMEEARAWKQALNGGETPDEVANRNGVSAATVEGRVSLLELPPETQKAVDEGRVKYTTAMEIVRNIRNGGDGRTKDGRTAAEVAANGGSTNRKTLRPRKDIEKRWADATDPTERNTLAWVLKMSEEDDGGVAVLPGEFDNNLPGEVGAAEELD